MYTLDLSSDSKPIALSSVGQELLSHGKHDHKNDSVRLNGMILMVMSLFGTLALKWFFRTKME